MGHLSHVVDHEAIYIIFKASMHQVKSRRPDPSDSKFSPKFSLRLKSETVQDIHG